MSINRGRLIKLPRAALRDGVATIGRLLSDETRNDVQRHEAASVVVARTVESLEKAKARITECTNYLLMAGQDGAQATFRLDPVIPPKDRGAQK